MSSPPAKKAKLSHSKPQPERPIAILEAKRVKAQSQLADEVFSKTLLPALEAAPLAGVPLLKFIDQISGTAFRKVLTEMKDLRLNPVKRAQAVRVVFDSDLAGIPEGSPLWFELLQLKIDRMGLCCLLLLRVLAHDTLAPTCGFDQFQRALLAGCARISQAYDAYWLAWLRSVQDPELLAALDDKHASTLQSRKECEYLLSPYTTIRVTRSDQEGGGFTFSTEPYAVFFKQVLAPVLEAFDNCLKDLTACPSATEAEKQREQKATIAYLTQYRKALAEESEEQLEPAWELTDRLWMDCKAEIQVVHDIEDGYSDPLRAKQGPDFSLRFLDCTYSEQNDTIKHIQSVICNYYETRDTPLSKDGLAALANTMAGIYYIPFKTGCSLVFAYSGQSIPNRLSVKTEKGVKIYFDAVETQARIEQTKMKVRKVFKNAQQAVLEPYRPDAVEQLVWHVAAHEVGHAIYGIRTMEKHVAKETVTLLEEPRAELTAMFALKLLHDAKYIDRLLLDRALLHFCLDGLRYFAKYDSQPMQPYIIFQVHAYYVYQKHGFLTVDPDTGLLTLDPSKTLEVLADFAVTFEQILDCCDLQNAQGGDKLEQILNQMREETALVKKVVQMCQSEA